MKNGYLSDLTLIHPPREGLTVSTLLLKGQKSAVTFFSLGQGTDISSESYPSATVYLCLAGDLILKKGEKEVTLSPYDLYLNPNDVLLGQRSKKGCGYVEIRTGEESKDMNCTIKPGEVFRLQERIDYRPESIVNRDLRSNGKRKFVLMALDKGQELSSHRAPGEALVFLLEGEARITYEGKDYLVKQGEEFHFAKGGLHALKALTPFKMALLLALE